MRRLGLFCLLAFSTSCASAHWVGLPRLTNAKPSEVLSLFVWSGSAVTPLSDVAVTGATPEGLTNLGKTNGQGEFHIAKAYIRQKRIDTLILCPNAHPFPCAAIRVSDPDVLAFDELNVNIPSYTLIDRFTIGSSH